MTSLRELQQAFVDGALFGYSASICAVIADNGIAPERRLNIYRNNAREAFLNTLEATFPTLVRLAGTDWFRQTGTEYMRRHPSRSGNLHYVGERFGDWLDAGLANTQYAYFADVARLEWAYQEVLVAADHPSFEIGALATIAPEDYPGLHFATHPAMRLVASAFPILAIWKANRPDAPEDATVDLNAGAGRVLIMRREDHVELRELAAGDFALLQAFSNGATFADAADAALDADASLDLGASLARVVQLGALVDFGIACEGTLTSRRSEACSDQPLTANR